MNNTSERVNRLSESATIAMARKARELKSQGQDIISLSLGDLILIHLILLKLQPKKE